MRCKGIIKTHNSSESCICLWKFNFKGFKGFKDLKGFKDCKDFKDFKELKGLRTLRTLRRGRSVNLEEQKACEGGIAYHANRIDTQEERASEGGKEECHADTELPRVNSRRTEVLNITQQQGGCGKQANNDGTQACEY